MALRAFVAGHVIAETTVCDGCLGSSYARLDTYRMAKQYPEYEDTARVALDSETPYTCSFCGSDWEQANREEAE